MPVFGTKNREGLVQKPRTAGAGNNPRNGRRVSINFMNQQKTNQVNLTPSASKVPSKDTSQNLYHSWVQQAINLESSNLENYHLRQYPFSKAQERAASQQLTYKQRATSSTLKQPLNNDLSSNITRESLIARSRNEGVTTTGPIKSVDMQELGGFTNAVAGLSSNTKLGKATKGKPATKNMHIDVLTQALEKRKEIGDSQYLQSSIAKLNVVAEPNSNRQNSNRPPPTESGHRDAGGSRQHHDSTDYRPMVP